MVAKPVLAALTKRALVDNGIPHHVVVNEIESVLADMSIANFRPKTIETGMHDRDLGMKACETCRR